MRDDRERLKDMVEAIERIEKYANRGKIIFQAEELIQTWIIYNLQIIGEAAKATSVSFKNDYPDIPWKNAGDLRNLVAHEYFRVDLDIIWDITQEDLPPLKQQIEDILEKL